ncbi:MAG TPA: Spy/CpxP family protein refolding chaperone [Aquabacterium sp.]|nr:Spy/CpxP family protein refolding chaperone [Aquabacterium sp.]
MSDTSLWSRVSRQHWVLGGLAGATALSVVLTLSAWAGEEPGGAGCPPPAMGMHGGPGMGMPDGDVPMGPPMMGRGLDRMLSHLNATAQQKDQIHKITQAAEPEIKSLRDQARALHEEGLKLWSAPKLDPQAAEQLRQKMDAHHQKMSERMLKLMLDVGQVLTPEQRAQMAQDMQSHRRAWSHSGHASGPAQGGK